MKIHAIKVWIILVAYILLLLTALTDFKMRQLSAQGYHKLAMTILKTSFRKTAPKELHYGDYNTYKGHDFKTKWKQNLATSSSTY